MLSVAQRKRRAGSAKNKAICYTKIMAGETIKKEDKLTVNFTNGALKKLNELATNFDTTPVDVLLKGMKLLDIAKDNKIVKEDADGKRYAIEVKEL